MKGKKHKIALVGPVYPFRGGISQYNTQLRRALLGSSNVLTISFSKLYPDILYPGESVIDSDSNGNKEPNTEYIIHAYKPWTIFNAAKCIEKADVNVAFLTWWTIFWQPGLALLAWLLKRKGIRVIYICHNVYDHDARGLKQRISKSILKRADGYVVHASPDENKLKLLTSKPVLNTKVLPVYDHYPSERKDVIKRGRLEILFFGFIRPYKGLDDIVKALAMLDDKEVYLSIVGEPWIDSEELSKQIRSINAPNIETCFRYVNDTEASFYFSRADLVVIPYREPAASAVASLAFNYKKPILGSNVEGIKDIIDNYKTGWLVDPRSPEQLKEKIAEITRKDAKAMTQNIIKFCDEHSWSSLAKKITQFSISLEG